MIDRYVLPIQKRLLKPVAALLVKVGISADAISIAGFAIGLLAAPLLALGLFKAALAAIVINRLFDGLDGAVARMEGSTDRGAYIDIAFDFFFYATVPLGFALFDPGHNALAAAGLVTAFMGTGSSFLAFAAVAAKRNISARDYPQKGIYYLGGLAEGSETIAVFIAMCLLPDHFAEIAWLYAGICMITTIARWWQGWVIFSQENLEMAESNEKPKRPDDDSQLT